MSRLASSSLSCIRTLSRDQPPVIPQGEELAVEEPQAYLAAIRIRKRLLNKGLPEASAKTQD